MDRHDTRTLALQPSLLDRLTDEEPRRQTDPPGAFLLGKDGLRAAVLRDLGWLMNATRLGVTVPLEAWPEVERSVLNYGLPALAGATASTLDCQELEGAIRQAILRFEPRILPETLQVAAMEAEPLPGGHNRVRLRISGRIWARPVPLEMELRTELDLETGQVSLFALTP